MLKMPKFYVEYIHEVEITYRALVEAESEDEAMEKVENCDFISEEEINWQGVEIKPQFAEEVEDDE
jgi:hypothetical protein